MSTTTDEFKLDDAELSRLTFSSGNDVDVEKQKGTEREPLPELDEKIKKHPHGHGHRLRSHSMIVTQLVKARRRAATAVSRHEIQYDDEDMATNCTIYDFLLIAILIVSIVFGTLFVIAALQPPEPVLLNLGEEFRLSNSTYIGMFFLAQPSDDALLAFGEASRRWSRIIAGSERLLPGTTESVACGFKFNPPLTLDHLNILVDIEAIDGAFGIVGSAGPCAFHNNIPTIGVMNLDSADIDVFAERGQLNSVILHEMAHVLGIGTLWAAFGFIQNPLPDNSPNLGLESPFYTGPLGTLEYQKLTGSNSSQLGIEDGFDDDGNPNGAGQGAVNGHFDEDSMQTELMTFRIRRNEQALSIVTIRCLEDFGYTVAVDEADGFALNPRKRILTEEDDILLINDIIDPTPFLEADNF